MLHHRSLSLTNQILVHPSEHLPLLKCLDEHFLAGHTTDQCKAVEWVTSETVTSPGPRPSRSSDPGTVMQLSFIAAAPVFSA